MAIMIYLIGFVIVSVAGGITARVKRNRLLRVQSEYTEYTRRDTRDMVIGIVMGTFWCALCWPLLVWITVPALGVALIVSIIMLIAGFSLQDIRDLFVDDHIGEGW